MSARPEPIAIVGMGCLFPGAPDLEAYWRNLVRGFDAIGEVPPARWDPVYYDPSSSAADRFYCRRGGFIDALATFDPLQFGLMPRAAEGAEPEQLLALKVAKGAIADAGLPAEGEWRQRTAVILGRGGYLTPGLARLDQRVRMAQQLTEILRSEAPALGEAQIQALKAKFQGELGTYGPDSAIGLVPNLAASRIANRLDLQGPAYTVDAACASSLLAVDQACRELQAGRCEIALAGGVHLCHDVTLWSVFTQLGALSRAQQIRPFDRRADGLLIGEGVGLVVLQRLDAAQRAGRRIYAQLLSVGISSDGQGAALLNPRKEGQVLALRRAWEEAGIDPAGLGFLEAHGTATPQGDAVELATLAHFFGKGDAAELKVPLGSVKSMIGHTMPAAGAAGLIKAALALHHGVIPPSLHCEEPHPQLEQTRFRVPAKAEPWPQSSGPRLAAVNAFGFGGINAHAILQGPGVRERERKTAESPQAHSVSPLLPRFAGEKGAEHPLVLSAAHSAELLEALEAGQSLSSGGPMRLVLFNPTGERRVMAKQVVLRERPWRGHDDLFFSPNGLLAGGGEVAFLFPGLEPTFEPRVADVAARFGWGTSPPVADGPSTAGIEATGLSVVAVSRLLHRALRACGLSPALMAGHSIGEWTGMVASEMIPPAAAEDLLRSLVPGTLEVPDVLFAMAGCSVEKANAALAGLRNVTVSHDNCPHQVILCGRTGELEVALGALREERILTQKLPFRSGFHSPLFKDYLAPHRQQLSLLPLQRPAVPLWSATSCAPYPVEPDAIRTLAVEHLVHAVRFRELVGRLHGDGVRFFVQVGAGNGLVGFVEDTLRGRPHLAVSANVKSRPGLAQLRRVLAAAYCEGADVHPSKVDGGTADSPESLAISPAETRPREALLSLGVPLVRLPRAEPVTASSSAASPIVSPIVSPGMSPIASRISESLRRIATVEEEIVSAFVKEAALPAPSAAPRSKAWIDRRRVSLATHPYLIDHCFYRQPDGWRNDADRFPLAPMTLSLEWLFEAAQAVSPERPVQVLENVRALRWLAVEPPVEVVVRADRRADASATVSIDGYATAVSPGSMPLAWSAPPALVEPTPLPISAESLYRDRWLFHGPQYQGVHRFIGWSAAGIDGELVVPPAPGGLLDNAGQLLGLWVMLRTEVDRLALPMSLDRVERFGPAPKVGDRLSCSVRIRTFDERSVLADLWLTQANGEPCCRILGWCDRRFESDSRLWEVLRFPERSLLSIIRPGGYLRVTDAWRSLPSRELLARRYLTAGELAQWEALSPKLQGPWLNGRIAIKDAVRELCWRQGSPPLFPVEVEVEQATADAPLRIRGPFTAPVRLSMGQATGAAVALASSASGASGASGDRQVGIEILNRQTWQESSEPPLSSEENQLLSGASQGFGQGGEPDALRARVFTAKRAVAKMRGAGMSGPWPRLPLQRIAKERLLIDGQWVETALEEPFVVAWSVTT